MLLESLELKKEINGMDTRYMYKIIETDYRGNSAYGISVSREYIKDNKVIDVYEDSIKYISPIKDKVEALLETLYKGQVSPIHLVDIAGEYVDNCVNDFCKLDKIAG